MTTSASATDELLVEQQDRIFAGIPDTQTFRPAGPMHRQAVRNLPARM